MNDYLVLKAFERHKEGDTVLLNNRQAKYLLLNGSVALKQKETPPTPTKKQEKGE